MNRRSLCLGAVLGIITYLTAVSGFQRVTAQEDPMPKWDKADFVDAKSFICAWHKGKGEDAVKVIEGQGFKIVDVIPEGKGVVCKWDGNLDMEKVEALRKNDDIRYVEPNFSRSISPNSTQGNVQQTIEFKPVYTKDNVLDELKKSKRMICAWEPGKGEDAVKAAKDLGLKIVDVQEGKWIVCTWTGELKQETIDKLLADPSIRYVEPDVARGIGDVGVEGGPPAEAKTDADPKSPVAVLPQDEFINQLYGMRNINAPLAWRNVQASPVVVAVCDTGVDYNHEDLRNNMWRNPKAGAPDVHGADFIDISVQTVGGKVTSTPGNDPKDRHFHGTHVAGTIGAVGNNKIGVAGVCWRVQIMAVRCLGADGFATANSIARSIDYAVENGAKIINLSLGGRKGPLQTELEVIKKAREKGVILVISAGNIQKNDTELDNDKKDIWPANYTKFVDNIVVVANTDINNKLNGGSHFGKTTVHLAAPGTDILSTMPMARTEGYTIEEENAKKEGRTITIPTKYGRLTGTSMSAPHVSGSLALILGHPKQQSLLSKSPAEIKIVLFNATKQLSDLSGKMTTGGMTDLSFLGEGAAPLPLPPTPPPPVIICPQKPPCIIICPPPCTCPQYPCRIFRRCRR